MIPPPHPTADAAATRGVGCRWRHGIMVLISETDEVSVFHVLCIKIGGPLVYRRRHVQIYPHFPSVLMLFCMFLRHSTPPQTMAETGDDDGCREVQHSGSTRGTRQWQSLGPDAPGSFADNNQKVIWPTSLNSTEKYKAIVF